MAGSEKSKKGESISSNQASSNFNTFFNTLDHMLGVVDLDGIFIEINKAGLKRLGYLLEDIRGKDAKIIFPADLHDEITGRFTKVREKGHGTWLLPIITQTGQLIQSEIVFRKGMWDNQETFFVVAKDLSRELMVSEARKISLRILNSVTGLKPDKISRMALRETMRLTQSQIGFFGSYDEASSALTNILWEADDDLIPLDSLPGEFVLSKKSGLEKKILKHKPILITEEHYSYLDSSVYPIINGMVVPLVDHGEVKYLVGLGNKHGEYNDLDKNMISILWDNVASKIKRIYAKLKLEENEFEYRNLFESSRDALILYDLVSEKIVLCNDEAVKLFGFKNHKELLSKSPLDLSAEIQPNGSRSFEELKKNPAMALHDKVYIPNWTHIKKNGEAFPAEVILSAVNYKGKQIILANVRDISEKIQTESEMRKKEESINLAIEEAELGTWDFKVESRKMIVGKGFSKIYEGLVDDQNIVSESWFDMVHPDDFDLLTKKFLDHIDGKSEIFRTENRLIGKDGKYKWVLASGKAIERDEEGKAIRIVGILMDIDSTKNLSKQVEDTRNFLETIISSIESILFVKDSEGRYLLVNRAFIKKLGLKGKSVLGKKSKDLEIAFDLDTSLSDDIVMKQGIEQTYEQEVRLSDNKLYDFLITKIPIRDKNDKIYAQVGLATDISHIKQLEKDLRNNVFSLDAAINGTGNGLWDWNPKTDELILNDNWFSMLGYTRSYFNKRYKKFGFNTFSDFIHPEDVAKVGIELEKHYAGKTEYYQTEIRMLTSDSQWKWILASGKVWEWDEDGKPVRMVGIHIDIDFRVRTEEQLKQALVKAEESDRLKSAFLANMSHEIRTPMNGIIGFLDLLESEEIPPTQRKEYMNIIRSSSVQLLNIVNDIVDISKIESGQVTVRESSFDLMQLINEIKMQYRPAIEDKHLFFKIDCKLTEKERSIKTDNTKLRQILSNLVSNSIKFTNEGGITLSCRRDGDYLEFCVADSGMGIPENIQKKVFERFIQAEMGLTRIQEGTGLGLSICKAYTEKLGGKIWLESKHNKGSKFFFTIPYMSYQEEDKKREKEKEEKVILDKEKIIPPDDSNDRVILVVEDEIYNFLFVEQVLQSNGIRVLHAESGQSAIDIVKKSPETGMVFMDIRMPGMDGYETTARLKKIRPDLPVVALTALALSGDREKAIQAGCDDYLKKPVLRDELLTIVNKYFKKK